VPLGEMTHFDEDRYSLEKRVERLEGDHAWTEDPPSRGARFVTNVRVAPVGGTDDLEARKLPPALPQPRRRPARRPRLRRAHRPLRPAAGGWLLASRHLVVDEAVLRTQNLALFL